jgi:hypothetical protein
MPEASELRAADGTRRLGDVMLMRCKKDIYEVLRRNEEMKARRQQTGVEDQFLEMGEKYGKYGVTVRGSEELDESTLRRMQTRAQARQTAGRMINRWVRDGRMPGAVMR